MNPLHDAILAALPGTMKELAERTGVIGQPLWDAVQTLRKAGIIIRRGPAKHRVFQKPDDKPAQAPSPDVSPGVAAAEAAKQEKKSRKRPVILFWVPDWPSQDPNRRMVWTIVWKSKKFAEAEFRRISTLLANEANWELASMTPAEARKLRIKGYDLREVQEREREMREKSGS